MDCRCRLLGYCAFVLADTWNFQRQASRAFDVSCSRLPRQTGADAMNGFWAMEIPRLGRPWWSPKY